MPEKNVDILIVGGGLAGASCAEGLREAGFEGSVLLAGREPHPPYQRPPCSKDLLRGESEPDDAHLHPDGWYEEHDVELLTRTMVMKLDTAAKTAELAHIGSVGFDRALLATGANIRRLRVEGGDHDGIHYLRTLGTSVSLREDAADAEKVVLIGGSYIACEVAASLTVLGKQCTLVMLEDGPLSTGFGKAASGFFAELLGSHGIEFVTGDGVARFEGEQARRARGHGVGQDARRRPRRDRRRRDPRRAPGAQRRARAGGERRREVLADARDVSARHLVRGRRVRVRLGRPRPAAAGGALRGRRRPGPLRGAGDDRRPRALRRGPLLLVRPRRLGLARVRRPGAAVGPRGGPRLVRQRRVQRLLLRRRAARGSAHRRALRRPGGSEAPDRRLRRPALRRAAARTGRQRPRRTRCAPRSAGCRAGSTRRPSAARSPRGPSAGRARW